MHHLVARRPVHFLPLLLLIFTFCVVAQAQAARPLELRITVHPAEVRAVIEGRFPEPVNRWSFPQEYAGISDLGVRVLSFAALDDDGQTIACQKLSPGTYTAARGAHAFRAEINLAPPARDVDAAHVSWLSNDRALLMLGDLVPAGSQSTAAAIELVLPAKWSAFSSVARGTDQRFAVPDVETAVFIAGPDLRQVTNRVSGIDFSLVTSGDWPFALDEAVKTIGAVLKEQQILFGGAPPDAGSLVILTPFPRSTTPRRWSAETRGRTITLLQESARSPAADLSLLGTNLAHELLHLWVPNGLRLSGSYDWFYEGFTLYQAMRVGVRLGQLTFTDFLNAVGRADDAYHQTRAKFGDPSLVEASRQRWAGQELYVYNKGLLVALLCDLTLRRDSESRRSLETVYADLYRRHGRGAAASAADGNQAALAALQRAGAAGELARSYVETGARLDLASALAPFGLHVSQVGARRVVGVAPQLTETQQKLLRQFGYNAPEKQDRERRERLKRAIQNKVN